MKKFIKLIVVVGVLGGAWAGWKYWQKEQTKTKTQENIVEVTVGNVESVVTAQGKLEPKEYVDVGAQVSGQVKKFHIEIGDQVKQGELIAEIDPEIYVARVEADQARMKTLAAQKAEQDALVKQAQIKNDRNQVLLKENAISLEAAQDAQINLETAKARSASLAAQMEEAQSTLEGDQTNLSFTKIYAPITGTMVSQTVKEGQTINANQTAPVLVQIANLDVMTARAQVAEADVSKLKPDMPVYFITLGSADRRWNGTIRQILPSPETVNDVVLYNVLVDVENKDLELMTGMTSQMFFVLGEAREVPVIPVSALGARVPAEDKEGAQAYKITLAGKDGQTKTIFVGLMDRTNASVIEGLQPGEKIVVPDPAPAMPSSNPAQGGGGRRMGGMPRL